MNKRRRWPILSAAGVVVLLAGGCAAEVDGAPAAGSSGVAMRGDAAVWELAPDAVLSADDLEFTAMVSRLGCSGGVTGAVLPAVVDEDDEGIVVTFEVETLDDGAFPCPGNDQVPVTVLLREPLGARELRDGACTGEGAAPGTVFCAGGAVRWDGSSVVAVGW